MSKQLKQLHPRIQQLRSKVGTTPIHKGHLHGGVMQPEEIRAANSSSDNRLIKAYHCIFGEPDDCGTVFHKGAFAQSIQQRGPSSNAKYKITTVFMHDLTDPLCVPSVIKEDDIGLYSEWSPDEGVPSADRTVIQVRSGTINNFSFGFNYNWDENAMKYDANDDLVHIYDCYLWELSPVTIGSQVDTYAVRGHAKNEDYLIEETEEFIKTINRKDQLYLRQLIDRHITLAKSQSLELRQKEQDEDKPAHEGLDFKLLLNHFKN